MKYILSNYFENINFHKFDVRNYLDYIGEKDNNLIYSSKNNNDNLFMIVQTENIAYDMQKKVYFRRNKI